MLDAPIASGSSVRAFNHLLGECELLICATVEQADRYRTNYPQSLDQAPFLMPLHSSSARRGLEAFFDRAHVRPRIVGEFEDSALMKVFGQLGTGLFPVPAVIQAEVERQHDVRVVGRVDGFVERFYAITAERRLKHPAVVAISEAARGELFGRQTETSVAER